MSKKVAVYGSLRKNFHNHGLLDNENCIFIGEGHTEPEYTLFPIASFPGIKKNGTTAVKVEVYEVKEDYLPSIDALEGYSENREPTFYDRQTVPIKMVDGDEVEAFIYEYVPSNTKPIIESGDWQDFFKLREEL